MPRAALYLNAEAREMARRDREMIPTKLVAACGVLALTALALTSFAVLTDRPLVGQPKAAAVLEERDLVLGGEGQGAHVTGPNGTILLSTDQGGFVAAVRQALTRERLTNGVEGNPPVTLTRFESGRIALSDPATGWSAELASFGADNTAAWLVFFD